MGDVSTGCCRLAGKVTDVRVLGAFTWLTLRVPGWQEARPGQFALLQADLSRCFLPRPFSVADQTGEQVSFLISAVGEGTRELCASSVGQTVWVLGPLGKGFDLEEMGRDAVRTVVVGGGVGVAPFPLLLRALGRRLVRETMRAGVFSGGAGDQPEADVSRRRGVLVLLGFRDARQSEGAAPVVAAAQQLSRESVACQVDLVREDGPADARGLVTDLLQRHVRPGDRLAVCGPRAMSEAVWEICRHVPNVRAWFSLESVMACGVGACHGCALRLADGSLARVCREGPVFSGEVAFGG